MTILLAFAFWTSNVDPKQNIYLNSVIKMSLQSCTWLLFFIWKLIFQQNRITFYWFLFYIVLYYILNENLAHRGGLMQVSGGGCSATGCDTGCCGLKLARRRRFAAITRPALNGRGLPAPGPSVAWPLRGSPTAGATVRASLTAPWRSSCPRFLSLLPAAPHQSMRVQLLLKRKQHLRSASKLLGLNLTGSLVY